MLRTKNKLTVFDDANSTFSDYSREALDFDRDTFTITLDSSTSYLYVGFYKSINIAYMELGTANTNAGVLAGEYYNGTAWVALTGLYDETNSMTRSGFLQWDRNLLNESVVTINSEEMYFYRFRPSVTHSATVVNGLNLVFADDNDLKRENYEISDALPSGESSFILAHVAARDEIIQYLRNSGHYKQSLSDGLNKDITIFDILDMGQIKLAATYLAMSKVMLSRQDEVDDYYMQQSRHYRSMYSTAIKTFYLDLDQNDDGIKDVSEQLGSATGRLMRR